jgi:small subunit ribosomal protein S6
MNHYELMVIFSSNLTEDEQKEQSLQVHELLKREKGELLLTDHWGKRKLAYPVKKQRQGYYDWIYFQMEPGRISEIDRKLKMSESILRFLCLRMEKIQIERLNTEIARLSEAAASAEQATAAAEATPAPAPAATEPEPETEQQPAQEITPEPNQG